MLDYPVIIGIATVSIALLAIMVTLTTGSIFAGLVVLGVSALVFYLLQTFGVLSMSVNSKGVNVDFHEKVPAPENKSHHTKHPTMQIKEVFYVEGNEYTFNDAPAVCAAYGAELATYDQLMEAFSLGAEWCGYGWSASGMALFPTQESTWSAMQANPEESKRTACGRPGVNGGYFDPKMKFGVNCYGHKPRGGHMKFPLPVPGTDSASFEKLVNKFKSMLHSMKVSPFSRDTWSEKGEAAAQVKKTKQASTSYLSQIGTAVENDI